LLRRLDLPHVRSVACRHANSQRKRSLGSRPSLEETLTRATSRNGGQLADPEPVTGLYRAFTRLGRLEGHVIDSSAQTPGQTAAALIAALDQGRLTLIDWLACAPAAGTAERR
jgi:hypothetical protein